MGVTLNLPGTDLFFTKMDYLHTVQVLLYYPNLKLTFLLCFDIVSWYIFGDSVIFCIAIITFLLSPSSEMLLNVVHPQILERALEGTGREIQMGYNSNGN